MPTNWKYIKKMLEKDRLCEKLKGRITYDLTDYKKGCAANEDRRDQYPFADNTAEPEQIKKSFLS